MEWDEYIHRETPSVPIREPQKVTLYAVKSFYVRLDGEKVRVDGYSFNIPGELVYTAGYLGDPSIPVLVRGRAKIDIHLAEKAKENFSSFEFNGERYPVHQVTAFDTRRGREILFCLEDGTRVRLVWRKEPELT